MKTFITIEVDHRKPIPALADMVAGRAYTIDGVTNAEVVRHSATADSLAEAGFTPAEISLGATDVVRS